VKSELEIKKLFTKKKAARLGCIAMYSNRRRIHSATGDLSPLDHELKLVA